MKKNIILVICIVIVLIVGIYLYNFRNNTSKILVANDKKAISNNIAIMLETSFQSGEYELSDIHLWPTRGYIFNGTRSYCENDSEISYDELTNKVSVNTRLADRCFIYFDVEPPDIILTLNNAPTTYGKTANLSCTGATATYDNSLNQIEISAISSDKLNCNMTYSTPSGTTPLNTYLLSLENTTQGDGKLVHEIGELPDYTNSNTITTFGSTPVYFRNTGQSSYAQTEIDDFWTYNSNTGVFTSVPSLMTTSGSSAHYHAYMKVPSAGYYQICYTIAQSESTSNGLYIAKNQSSITSVNSSTSSQIGENCIIIGYLNESDYFNISERGYSGTSSPIISFRVEKANSIIPLDTGYRYQGKNPNNYIWFNNELWRIIGIFDETSHGQNNQNLVKIIRNETLGGYAWNSNNNYWVESRVAYILNYIYYNWELYSSNANNYCYLANAIKKQCDFSAIGIQDGYRDMIANTSWFLGGGGKAGYTIYTSYNIYSYERDSNTLYSNGSITRNLTGNMKIGLMYESDFLLSTQNNDCSHQLNTSNYTNDCKTKNWLYKYNNEFTIDNNTSGQGSVWYINSGTISSNPSSNGYSIRPVLYLKSNVYKVLGTGTITDPYIIGM